VAAADAGGGEGNMLFLILLLRILLNATIGAALGASVMLAPLPAFVGDLVRLLQVPVGVLILICTLGKILYDTLFWDRYTVGRRS
jgi:hypothetical protein